MLNCLTHLLLIVQPYDFALYKAKQLKENMDERAESLATEHYSNILKESALDGCVSICENNPTNEPISRVGDMQPEPLQSALRAFASWLSGSEVDHSPRLAALLDQRVAERVHRAALIRLVKAYALVCSEVRKPENRYEAANTLLGAQRPFGQLPALRAIFGLSESDVE